MSSPHRSSVASTAEAERGLAVAQQAWSSADESLAAARAAGESSAAKETIISLVTAGLPGRARVLAPGFGLVVGADGIVRP